MSSQCVWLHDCIPGKYIELAHSVKQAIQVIGYLQPCWYLRTNTCFCVALAGEDPGGRPCAAANTGAIAVGAQPAAGRRRSLHRTGAGGAPAV